MGLPKFIKTAVNFWQAMSLLDSDGSNIGDGLTASLKIVNHAHFEIHSGNHFNVCDFVEGLALNALVEFIITTPDTAKWGHFRFNFASILGVKLDIYKDPVTIVGGTSITPLNNNQNSVTASGLAVLKDPTSIAGDGTKITGHLAGANRTGGSTDREDEIILKQNTLYLFRFTSLAASNTLDWCFKWYEETFN